MKRTFSPGSLQVFAAAVLARFGAPVDTAAIVAGALVRANLHGHDSHGLLRLPRYVDKIRSGTLDPRVQPQLGYTAAAIAVVDGRNGFGQPAARLAANTVIDLAKDHGVGSVALQRSQHIGRLADYAETISAAGMIALIFTAGTGPGGSVAPFGGRERRFGTNPLAWGLPVPEGRGPLVADFSTSAWPEGKVAVARSRDECVPAGILVDRDGRATTDPHDLYAGGALLPFGGAKGSSLALFIEVMAGILGGSAPATSPELRPGNPTVMIALKVEAFLPVAEYERHVSAFLWSVENCPPAAGFEHVLLPNTLEIETAEKRRRDGIPLPDSVLAELEGLARETGVSMIS